MCLCCVLLCNCVWYGPVVLLSFVCCGVVFVWCVLICGGVCFVVFGVVVVGCRAVVVFVVCACHF